MIPLPQVQTRDPSCPCAHCNPVPLPWSERWIAIAPAWVSGIAFCVALWAGEIF